MNPVVEAIRTATHGRHPLLYLHTPEEGRVLAALEELLPEYAADGSISAWSCVSGLDGTGEETRDPVAALRTILMSPHEGFYVMKDLSEFIDRPEVVRALRDAYQAFRGNQRTCVVIVSPALVIPPLLENELCLLDVALPVPAELLAHAKTVQDAYPGQEIPEELHSEIALALRGLTLAEAAHVMHRVFNGTDMAETAILEQIFAEKEMLARKAGFLEYIPQEIDVDGIGGLEILKDWALKRKDLFTQESVDAGLPIPRGILIMGISGCGKSLSCKAIASLWHVPLFRLDMNLVFSGMYGTPQAAFHRALKAIESVAPAVLWIDEIENALGMTTEHATSEQTLTFSSFLTWMQERPPLVFVAATANRIESLPAESIRKGRFDEVFFCDLPSDDERREIIRIHLARNGVSPEDIDVERLLYSTEGWSGAEVEQAIIAARIDAHQERVPMNLDHIRNHTRRMVPLSRTMAEQIKAIRSWSHNRATPASKTKPKSMIPT
jgi:hypothetical protein